MNSQKLTVNNHPVTIECDDNTPLLYVLRNDLNIKGPRFGCGTGHCGACTVIVNGNAVQSCDTPMWSVIDAQVHTIESLTKANGELHPLQEAFIEEQAVQCGYCIPGIIMTVKAQLDKYAIDKDSLNADKLETTILHELTERNLCRCGTQFRIIKAIRKVINQFVDEHQEPSQ